MCVAHTNELDVKSAQHSWVQTSLQKQSSSLQIGVNWVVNWSRGGGGGNSWEIKGDHYKVVQQSGRGEPWTYLCMYRWENLEGPQRKNFLGFSALAGEGIPLQRKENSSAEDLQLSSSDAQGSHLHTKTWTGEHLAWEMPVINIFYLFYLHLPLKCPALWSSSNCLQPYD